MSDKKNAAGLLQSDPAAVQSERSHYERSVGFAQGRTQQIVCPICGKKSLSVTQRGEMVLAHCHYGCPQDSVWRALQDGMSAAQPPEAKTRQRVNTASPVTAFVRNLWSESLPADTGNTLVVQYLASRGITASLPATIRFLPNHLHKPSGTSWPIMLASVTDCAGKLQAVHRTYLAQDGKSKAPVTPQKMTLGPVGGFACHLGPATEEMAVSEGIETGLSVQLATGIATWAALSAGGIRNLIMPQLPLASCVTICADNDPVGMRSAQEAAHRWREEGRHVKIALPPEDTDFNDVLMEVAQ